MSTSPDVTLAYADKMLYEAAFTGFYGTIAFSFKAGTIVLVRKEETLVVPSTATDEPNRDEARVEEQRANDQNGVRHHR